MACDRQSCDDRVARASEIKNVPSIRVSPRVHTVAGVFFVGCFTSINAAGAFVLRYPHPPVLVAGAFDLVYETHPCSRPHDHMHCLLRLVAGTFLLLPRVYPSL